MTTKFSHLALLVNSAEDTAATLNSADLPVGDPEFFEGTGTKEIYVGNYGQNSGLLLLMEPHGEGPYKQAMAKRGPSIHHIAIDVLDLDQFLSNLKGWLLHPSSVKTIADSKTAYLSRPGIPTLIEVQQVKSLSTKPPLISKVGLNVDANQIELFKGIGLGEIVFATTGAPTLKVTDRTFNLADLFER